MGNTVRLIALLGLGLVSLAAQEAIYPDGVIAEHQVGLFTNRQAWPPQLLQSTISPTATSFSVGTSAGLVTPGVVQIKNEIIKVSSESSGTITVWSVASAANDVADCSNASPIVVTTVADHNLTGAERVTITGTDVANCNVTNAPITRLGAKSFSLDGTSAGGVLSVTGSWSANGRGYDDTTAATHLAGSTVSANIVAAQLTQLFREIEELEKGGGGGGGVAGVPFDIQLNIGNVHDIITGFTYNGLYLNIPRASATHGYDPAIKGGAIVLEEPTGGIGGGAAGINMDFDTVTGFRIYHSYDADLTMGYFNFAADRRLDVQYDGNIQIVENDRYISMRDTSGTDSAVVKMDGSNHVRFGPDQNLPGTPDIWFYKDGAVVSKFGTDGSNAEISFIPSTDQDRQIGAYDAMWQRIIGLRVDVGRSTSTTEVQGTLALHTGSTSFPNSPATMKGYADSSFFPIPAVHGIEILGSLTPTVDNQYGLGTDNYKNTGADRRWKEAHIVDLYVNSCTGCGSAGHPVVDTTYIIEDDGNSSRQLRFELGGLSLTGRTLTPQDSSYTIAGLETTQTFTGQNTFNNLTYTNHVYPTSGAAMSLGNVSFGSDQSYGNSYIQDMRANRLRIGTYNVLGSTDYHRWEIGAGLNISQIENNAGDPVLHFDSTNTLAYSPSTVDVDSVRVDADMLPYSNSNFFLGSTSYRWKELHADKGFFPSGVTAGTTSGSPGCTSGPPASGGDNGRLYWDTGTQTLYVCSNGSPVTVYP